MTEKPEKATVEIPLTPEQQEQMQAFSGKPITSLRFRLEPLEQRLAPNRGGFGGGPPPGGNLVPDFVCGIVPDAARIP